MPHATRRLVSAPAWSAHLVVKLLPLGVIFVNLNGPFVPSR